MKVDQFKRLEELGFKFIGYTYYDNEDKYSTPMRSNHEYEFSNKNSEETITVNVYDDKEITVEFEKYSEFSIAILKAITNIDWEVL